jgi:glycine/D-amino acid oxidase-like deaminating enzyme
MLPARSRTLTAMAAGASVVVVGGGVMGCSIAFHLAERGTDVLVLERGTVCSGMTARSGGLSGWCGCTTVTGHGEYL